MAVLSLIDDKTLYLVIVAPMSVRRVREFMAMNRIYDNYPDADEAAKKTAELYRSKAWVVGIERPSLIELVPDLPKN